jgi:hypothetical protein
MKKKYLVSVLVLVFTALPVAVHAQQDQTDPKRLEREKRVSQRISSVKPNLTDAQKIAYKNNCKGAQTKVAVHLKNAIKFSDKHDKKFLDMIDRVNKLVERLKVNGREVSQAEAAVDKAIQTNVQMETAYKAYILALTDTAQLDCQADVEGFRASIDEAKKEFKELRKLRADVRKTIKQDLKASLQSIISNS